MTSVKGESCTLNLCTPSKTGDNMCNDNTVMLSVQQPLLPVLRIAFAERSWLPPTHNFCLKLCNVLFAEREVLLQLRDCQPLLLVHKKKNLVIISQLLNFCYGLVQDLITSVHIACAINTVLVSWKASLSRQSVHQCKC